MRLPLLIVSIAVAILLGCSGDDNESTGPQPLKDFGRVVGRIVNLDEVTELAISVSFYDTIRTVWTDNSFLLDSVPPGHYAIDIRARDHFTESWKNLPVLAEQVVDLGDIRMGDIFADAIVTDSAVFNAGRILGNDQNTFATFDIYGYAIVDMGAGESIENNSPPYPDFQIWHGDDQGNDLKVEMSNDLLTWTRVFPAKVEPWKSLYLIPGEVESVRYLRLTHPDPSHLWLEVYKIEAWRL